MALRNTALLALLALSAVAAVRAVEVSQPKKLSGRLSCVLPITKLTCVRDWRSGFVAGIFYGNEEISGETRVCGGGRNVTSYEMSTPSAIDRLGPGSKPEWLAVDNPAPYLYPFNSPITQVIVLEAKNPFGDEWGKIAAVLFGYLKLDGKLDFAVCGNAQYAHFYLNPSSVDPPPTPVKLKASYTSPLSADDKLTALGGFNGVCSVRGGYLGGDPWSSQKFFPKKLDKFCFTEWDKIEHFDPPEDKDPPKREEGTYHCEDKDGDGLDDHTGEICFVPCHYDKKHAKKSTSFSCAHGGSAIATGKYGAIVFDKYGAYDWHHDGKGNYEQVPYTGGYDGIEHGDEYEAPEVTTKA